MEKEIILLYKAVNNEDEHNNMLKSHNGIMPLNIENYFNIIVVVYNNLYYLHVVHVHCTLYMYMYINWI